MSRARSLLMAGAFAAIVTASHAAYRWWPASRGTEIVVPAAMYSQDDDVPMIRVELPLSHIELDVRHTMPVVTEPFERVRHTGTWWATGQSGPVNARALRGRAVYLQLAAGPLLWPGGPPAMYPASVSDRPVAGAVNLAATVERVREDGYLWLRFPFGLIPVPRDIAAHARSRKEPFPRPTDAAPPPPFDPGVYAVLRVLPSGRATLTGLIVNGTRY